MLAEGDILPPWPIDITTKQGQRMIKEISADCHRELWEAEATLKNKLHRVTDERAFDREHFIEELGDTLAYFMEICILSGISPYELYEEYKRKNAEVKQKYVDGY